VYEIIPYDIAYIVNGTSLADRVPNVLLWSGIEVACDAHELRCKYYIPDSMGITDIIDTIDLAAGEGADLVIVQGFEFDHAMYVSQNDHPDVQFLLFESVPVSEDFSDFDTATNTLTVVFDAYEKGFLAGYSLVVEGYTNLAFFSGMSAGLIQEHGMGFVYGAYYAANELGVDLILPADAIAFYGSFEPSPGVVEMALDLYDNGVEVVYCPLSPLCDSVAEAADQVEKEFLFAETKSYASHASYLGVVGIRYDVIVQALIEEYLSDTLQGWPYRKMGVSDDAITMDYRDPQVFDAAWSASLLVAIKDGTIVVPGDEYDFMNLMQALPNTKDPDVPQLEDIVVR
jgi:basic membrane protein A